MRSRRLPLAIGLDLLAVMLFVILGRRTHDEGNGFMEIAETAAPFLVGLGAGWLLARGWRRPERVLTGLIIWPTTLLVGMIVRSAGFDDGTATSFVIVATMFLGAAIVGWRLVVSALDRRRRLTSQSIVYSGDLSQR